MSTAVVPGLRPADVVMFAFYLVLLALGVAAVLTHDAGPLGALALALSLPCAALWFVARRQLGLAFSVRPEARHLVDTGLYAKVRHPVYVFGTAAFLLVLLGLLGLPGLVWWAILIPVQIVRARREESVLAAAFGPAYDAYRRSTWF